MHEALLQNCLIDIRIIRSKLSSIFKSSFFYWRVKTLSCQIWWGYHSAKIVHIRSHFWCEYREIRIRNNSIFGHFSRSVWRCFSSIFSNKLIMSIVLSHLLSFSFSCKQILFLSNVNLLILLILLLAGFGSLVKGWLTKFPL